MTAAYPLSPPDRCCGACQHWPEHRALYRLCQFAPMIPQCWVDHDKIATRAQDGRECLCWERRVKG